MPRRNTKGGYIGQWPDRDGYRKVALSRNGRKAHVQIGRLVLLAFVGQCPEGHQCAHYNNDPADNRAENLRWATSGDNIRDKQRHGTQVRGERQHRAVLTADKVRQMRRLYRFGVRGRGFWALAKRFGVAKSVAMAAVKGKTWAHVR
jgi:hypothetical protein